MLWLFEVYMSGKILTSYLEVQVFPVLPFVLPLQETQGDHPCLVYHLVHLAAQLHMECRSLYLQHHLKSQHSSGFCALEQLLQVIMYVYEQDIINNIAHSQAYY